MQIVKQANNKLHLCVRMYYQNDEIEYLGDGNS